ncbi:lysine-rich nucleolar protein 1 [Antennarius striatus]|uniref:lysine-rich nucleolar protein 1 n=1 Tax=Antennarius striatus TaxID=241820 RepID=UPI0035B42A96
MCACASGAPTLGSLLTGKEKVLPGPCRRLHVGRRYRLEAVMMMMMDGEKNVMKKEKRQRSERHDGKSADHLAVTESPDGCREKKEKKRITESLRGEGGAKVTKKRKRKKQEEEEQHDSENDQEAAQDSGKEKKRRKKKGKQNSLQKKSDVQLEEQEEEEQTEEGELSKKPKKAKKNTEETTTESTEGRSDEERRERAERIRASQRPEEEEGESLKKKKKKKKRKKDGGNHISANTDTTTGEEEETAPRRKTRKHKSRGEEEEQQEQEAPVGRKRQKRKKLCMEQEVSPQEEVKRSPDEISTNQGFGQWTTAQFSSSDQRQKFLRLMGGLKGGFRPAAGAAPRANMALGQEAQQQLQQGLLGQFEHAQSRRSDFRSAGLGFTGPPRSKFSIDISACRSVRFED